MARKWEATFAQIAKDFGISEAILHAWIKKADVEDGVRPGMTSAEATENRELRKRNRVLEQENEILRRAAAYSAREPPKKNTRWSLTLPPMGSPSR
jgi:transposase